MFKRLHAVVALLLCTVAAGADESADRLGAATVGELQAIVDAAAMESGVAGAQVSVILGDRRADLVYGTANAELGIPMTADTIIQIGSSTKIFNAAIAMTLVDEGKIDLDAPIGTYIPGFEIADMQAGEIVSYRHLLSMSSGLDNGPYTTHGGGEDALARYVASLADLPQAFRPGTGFGYSNAGTSIAGYASERVAGESWDLMLKKRIFEPAGLKNAVTLAQELPFQRVSVGHVPAADGDGFSVVRPWYISQAQGPAGSTLAMSAHDLASFGDLFLNGGMTPDGIRVLSETAVKTMMTPTTEVPVRSFARSWGLGPYLADWGDTHAWGHAGGNQSGASYLWWFPERLGVLAVIVNTPATSGPFMQAVFEQVGSLVFAASKPRLEAPDPPLTVADPTRYTGTYAAQGQTFEVSALDGGLRLVATVVGAADQELVVAIDTDMTPLGNDRFMIVGPDGQPTEMAFFNVDADGRATNLVAPVFPARRVD